MNLGRSPDDLHHAVLDGRTKSTVDRGRIGRGRDRVERRRRQGRDHLERFDGLGGEPLEAVLDEFLKPFRDRGPFAGRHLTPTTQERASDLLGEEGIAARRLVDAEERGSREAFTHLVAEHPFDRVDGERPDVDAMHVTLGERPGDAQGVFVGVGASNGCHQADRLVLEAARDELEHPDRGQVHPLDVVDGHDDGGAGRHRPKASEDGQGDRPLVGPGARTRGPQEGHLEGPALRLRQGRERVLEDRARGGHRGRRTRDASPPRPDRTRAFGTAVVGHRSRPSFHTVVFPIPASPERSRAPGPAGIASRKRSRIASSGSRPMTSPAISALPGSVDEDSRVGVRTLCRPRTATRSRSTRPPGRT